jgi:hypothetical protein
MITKCSDNHVNPTTKEACGIVNTAIATTTNLEVVPNPSNDQPETLSASPSNGYQELLSTTAHKVIKVVLGEKVKIVASLADDGSTISQNGESLQSLMNKVNGISAVNAGYFCPKDYSHCNSTNESDRARVHQGNLSYKWF